MYIAATSNDRVLPFATPVTASQVGRAQGASPTEKSPIGMDWTSVSAAEAGQGGASGAICPDCTPFAPSPTSQRLTRPPGRPAR